MRNETNHDDELHHEIEIGDDSASASDDADDIDPELLSTVSIDARDLRRQRWQQAASAILFSKYFALVYVFMFLLTLFLVIWGAVHHQLFSSLEAEDEWYIALDVLLTLVFAAEVALRIMSSGEAYWKSCVNLVDFVVMVACVFALGMYFLDPETSIVGSAVLMVRYLIQIARVVLILKHHRERQSVVKASMQDIDFSAPYTQITTHQDFIHELDVRR